MSIVLSASVRQNLLSLQSTADLLSTTQNRLATGKRVNSALDNPTNYFTAQGLDARANDISQLLDGVSNGVQIIQAANTGITSLQKLVDTAKSIGNQALQTSIGYTSTAHVDLTGAGAGAGVATEADLTGGGTSKLAGATLLFQTQELGAFVLGITAQNSSLAGLNKSLSDFGFDVVASLTGPNTLTFTSTSQGASQAIITSTNTSYAPGLAANTLRIGVSVADGTAGSVVAAVPDSSSQVLRANLVGQYNAVIKQIGETARDSSFNGVNLLNADTLKLIFNETGKSNISVQGVDFSATGLGLRSLTSGSDLLDNRLTNLTLGTLNNASGLLRSEASALGSNLSIVEIRQNFSKNLINVLQTGSSKLTLADANEEAANSQTLATRQSIAVSALALANQSQQSVLQLLR